MPDPDPGPAGGRTPSWRVGLWLGLVTLVVYIGVTANKFVWDDKYFIVQNYALRQPGLLFSQFFKVIPLAYRPAMFLSLALDFKVWGLDPAGFHLTNLLLHVLNVLLVYLFASRLLGGRSFAPLAGLVFALHPVHSEAVAAMLGRSDLVVTMFSLLGLLAYQGSVEGSRPLRRGGLYAFSLLMYAGACLTKESGIILPGLIVLTENLGWGGNRARRGWKGQTLGMVPFAVIGLLYLAFLRTAGPVSEQTAWGGGGWQTAMLMMGVAWHYLALLVFPFFLHPYYITYWPTGWDFLQTAGGGLALLGGLFLILRYFRFFPLLAWALAWIGIALLPVANIIPIPGAMMAERWLYLPSIGLCVLAGREGNALLVRSTVTARRALIGAGVVVLALFAGRIVTWIPIWHDELALNRFVIKEHPESMLAHVNLGNSLYLSGKLKEAKAEYLQAFLLNPGNAQVHLNLGNVYCAEGDTRKGIKEYRKAVSRDSTLVPAWVSLGTAYQARGEADSALAQYRRVLRLDPLNVPVLNQAGVLHLEKKDYAAAEKDFRRALALSPSEPGVKDNLERAIRLRAGKGQ
jgi:tetratricopeptide (TPR) repeat protein